MDYINAYAKFLKKFLKPKKKLKGVFDASNGATGVVLRELKKIVSDSLEMILINDTPDGNFPAHGPDPLKKGASDQIGAAVREHGADFGAIFDADGDRAFFVDDQGRMMIPDAAIILIAQRMRGSVVLTPNIGAVARRFFARHKREMYESKVGHYFIKQVIKREGAVFGAEHSGHYYFKDFFYADSGILSSMVIATSVSKLKTPLSVWIDALPQYHRSGEVNIEIQSGQKEEIVARMKATYADRATRVSELDGLRMDFTEPSEWWFIVRASNTEPLMRLTLEAKNRKVFEKEIANVTRLLQSN